MQTPFELIDMREKLLARLAAETYRIGNPHHDQQLDAVARVLAGIKAIDMVLEYKLDAPKSDGPDIIFIS